MKNIIHKIKELLTPLGTAICKPFGMLAKTKVGNMVIRTVKIPFVGYLLLACVLNFFLEVLSRHSVLKAIAFIGESPLVFLYNASIIFVTLSLVLFAKRKVFATVFVCAVWIISAFANYIVLCFRTTPFSAIDLLMIRNVMTMLDKYMTKWQMVLSAIGVVLIIALLVYLYIRLPKSTSKRRPFRASAYVIMSLFLIYTLTKVAVETQTVSDNFGNLAYAYNDYGFAYCFSNSIIDVGISKPKNYNENTIRNIVQNLDYDKSEVILITKEEYESHQTGNSDNRAIIEDLNAKTEENTDVDIIDESETGTEYSNVASSNVADGLPGVEGEQSYPEEETDSLSEVEENTSKEETQEYTFFENEAATVENPNIIVIQLESIFDVKYMKDFYPSKDPTPTLTRLKKNYSSGLFTVPAVGAGTANTEFEVQTGMSTQFFGAGEYPFKTVMRSVSCDSMAYDLKRVGYATAGFHNNDATFYERYVDYSNLGFDSFTAMEHMYNLNYTPRGWAKDDVLDDVMIERMKQTKGRDYITTITVQGHGRYPKSYTPTLTDLTCSFGGKYEGDEEKRAAWTYYINMCRETDNMVASLLDKLEALDEPTVVFMYGDHLPSLNLEESDLDGINLYQTEWMMWDNIGLLVENKDLYAYQASTYIFNRLGLKGGLMQSFHNRYMEDTDRASYLSKLEMLEYDTLYGEVYAFDQYNPFPQTNMKLGLRDVQINSFEQQGENLFVLGKNFNEFSEVYVNGKTVKTKYIHSGRLQIDMEDIEDRDEIYVAQAGDDHVVLSITDSVTLDLNSVKVLPDIQEVESTEDTEEEDEA